MALREEGISEIWVYVWFRLHGAIGNPLNKMEPFRILIALI